MLAQHSAPGGSWAQMLAQHSAPGGSGDPFSRSPLLHLFQSQSLPLSESPRLDNVPPSRRRQGGVVFQALEMALATSWARARLVGTASGNNQKIPNRPFFGKIFFAEAPKFSSNKEQRTSKPSPHPTSQDAFPIRVGRHQNTRCFDDPAHPSLDPGRPFRFHRRIHQKLLFL